MKRLLYISLVWVWIGPCNTLFGTDQPVRYLTTEMGLNNGAVNDIVQDADGYIWLATWDGVIRYDGISFKNYKPDVASNKSLQARQAINLLVDSKDNLWVLTYAGISRYNKDLDHFEQIALEEEGFEYTIPYPNSEIIEVQNTLYFYRFNELYYFDLNDQVEGNPFRRLETNIELFSGLIAIASIEQDLIVVRRLTAQNRSEVYHSELIQEGAVKRLELSLSFAMEGQITEIHPLDQNRLIITKQDEIGIRYLNGTSLTYEVLVPNVAAENLISTSNYEIWYILPRGLGCVNLHTGVQRYYEHRTGVSSLLLSNQINSLFEDFSGNLWIGHLGQGISILNLHQKSFNSFRHIPGDPTSLSENTVMCFQETNNGILVGTDNDGVNLLTEDPKTGHREFSRFQFPDNFEYEDLNSVWDIARVSENSYWMATSFGLIESKKQGDRWEHKQHFIAQNKGLRMRKVLLDDQNNLWLGTYNGLYLIPYNRRDAMSYHAYLPDPNNESSISDDVITEILIDSKNRFWIGTRDQGINLLTVDYTSLNLNSHTAPVLNFKEYNAGDSHQSLNNKEINCLFEYYDGTIWAGTQGGGINILDPETGRIEYITMEDGLPGDNVFGIQADDQGNIWLSTNKGLCSISTFETERKIASYDIADGVQGNVFMVNSFFKDSRGMLYFGGRNGFTRFSPSQIRMNQIPPRLVFTDLLIFGDKIEVDQERHKKTILSQVLNQSDTLTLSYKDYSLRIGVSAIHFQNPSKNSIQYKLEGFEKSWRQLPNGERYIYFSNLNPGRYDLHVRASNSDGVWSEQVRQLHLVITPPWYNTWYGYAFFLILAAAALVALFQLILKQQVLRHKIKLDAEQIENMKVVNESKLRFFTNISHELRTPLNLVLAPIEYIYKYKDITPAIKEQLSMSLRNAKLLKRLINNIIEFRKFEADKVTLKYTRNDIVEFIRHVCRNFETLQPNTNIQLTYHLPKDSLLTDFDSGKLEQVLYNILSNAFKHTPNGGTILLNLEQSSPHTLPDSAKEEVVITVYNEGEPIKEEHISKIFDRFYQTDDRGEGSGIGLSVAKSFIELHQGSLSVRNVENSGVEFCIKIPRYTDSSKLVSETLMEETIKAPEKEDVDLKVVKGNKEDESEKEVDLKLLVIEDNVELRKFYHTILSPSFKFFEADNGDEGISMAEELIPDIIISDVMMPGKNGYEVCKHLKTNLMTSHIPLIMLTAKDAPEQIVEGYNSGADAYVIKPFESEVLISQIHNILKNRERIREKYISSGFVVNRNPEAPRSKDDHFMKTLNDELEENLFNEDYNVVSLSKKLNISRNHLYRKVKALTGYSTVEYIRVYKLNKAAELLKTQKYSIKEVCFKTGFKDQSYFTKSFKNHFNQNPTEFIKTYSQAQ